jgi:hypothetical protein
MQSPFCSDKLNYYLIARNEQTRITHRFSFSVNFLENLPNSQQGYRVITHHG